MQRIGGLFEVFCGFQNLLLAWKKTRKGSGKSAEGALFFQGLENELFALQAALIDGSWAPQPFRYFDIYDPKHRTIAVSAFRDRLVHHALVNVLEPVFEKSFIFDSYATRKGKGVHAAVFRAQHFLCRNRFYLKTDVEKFFDSVPHDLLLTILRRKIKDRRLLEVCEKIVCHGQSFAPGFGLPIGNRTSQFFANVYLNVLDHFIKDRLAVKGYVRYMDDFVIFHNDRNVLKSLRARTEDFLGENLMLQLKSSATFLNRPSNGLPFLGRRIFPGIIRLRTENLRRITARMGLRERQLCRGDIDEATFQHSMNSYWAMLSYYPELKPLRQALMHKPHRST